MNTKLILDSLEKLGRYIEAIKLQNSKMELYDANRFNPFRFMKTDELGLSTILAFLLNPDENHGQRDLFLNAFLKYLDLPHFLAYKKITLYTEKTISGGKRRHDIFIEAWIGSKLVWVMSIENKLRGAVDQSQQVKDYLADLERYQKNYIGSYYYFVYLPATFISPKQNSISEEKWSNLLNKKQVKTLSARDLINWLEQTPIIAQPVQQFADYFKNFLSEEIMGATENSDELVAKIINNDAALEAAITIFDNIVAIYQQLLDNLIEQLTERWEKHFGLLIDKGWKLNHDSNFENRYFSITFDPVDSNWGIGLEFASRWFEDAYYGVWAHHNKIEKEYYDVLQNAFSDFKQESKQNKYWLGWKQLDGNLKNWDAETWKQLRTGKLADQVFETLEPLLKIAVNLENDTFKSSL